MEDKHIVIYKIEPLGKYVAVVGTDFKKLTTNFFTGVDDIERTLLGTFKPWSFCKVTMSVGNGEPYVKKAVRGTQHLLQIMQDPNFRGIARVDEETLGLVSVSENIEVMEDKNNELI